MKKKTEPKLIDAAFFEKYYRQRLKGLLLILSSDGANMIATSYVEEKLNAIMEGYMGFHPTLIEHIVATEKEDWIDNFEYREKMNKLKLLEEL